MTTPLVTRKSTGAVPAPSILIVGDEESGKTHKAFELSSSPRVGATYVIDIDEGCAGMYAALGPYEVVEHDGTLEGLAEVARAISELPVNPQLPDVDIIDSSTAIWALAKNWAEHQARERHRKKGRSGEPNMTMDLWDSATEKFYLCRMPLFDWPGIVIVTARGRFAALVEGGKPVPGEQVWTVVAQTDLGFHVDLELRSLQARRLEIKSGRTMKIDLPSDGFFDIEVTLDELIFDRLGVESAGERNTVRPDARLDKRAAAVELLPAVGGDRARAGEVWGEREFITRKELDELLKGLPTPSVEDPLEGAEPLEVADAEQAVAA